MTSKTGQTKKLLKLLNANSCCDVNDCPPISTDENNGLECRSNGLYVSSQSGGSGERFGVPGEDDSSEGLPRVFNVSPADFTIYSGATGKLSFYGFDEISLLGGSNINISVATGMLSLGSNDLSINTTAGSINASDDFFINADNLNLTSNSYTTLFSSDEVNIYSPTLISFRGGNYKFIDLPPDNVPPDTISMLGVSSSGEIQKAPMPTSSRFGLEDNSASEDRGFYISGDMFNIYGDYFNFVLRDESGFTLERMNADGSGQTVSMIEFYSIYPPVSGTTSVLPPSGEKHNILRSAIESFGYPYVWHGLDFVNNGKLYYFHNVDNVAGNTNSVGYRLDFPVYQKDEIDVIETRNVIVDDGDGFTLTASHFERSKTLNLTPTIPLTIDVNDTTLASVPIGACVNIIQATSPQIDFTASGGATINVINSGTKIAGRFGIVCIMKTSATEFLIFGDIIP